MEGATISFDKCENLGAVNLRGTGFASSDHEVRELSAKEGEDVLTAEVNVSGLAGFLLAKTAAAYSRRKEKGWYDIAFVLLHNDAGGTAAAIKLVKQHFLGEIAALQTALNDLKANFENTTAQGSQAYVTQMHLDHPELDHVTLAAEHEHPETLGIFQFHDVLAEAGLGQVQLLCDCQVGLGRKIAQETPTRLRFMHGLFCC